MIDYNNISPIVLKILNNRGIDDEQKLHNFLHPTDQNFYDPFLLTNMDRLVSRINLAIENGEKVLIFGDYDVDGVSATAILIKYFASRNFYVDYFLPNRYVDGYGLTKESIIKVKQLFNPTLIITVDCGIACHEEVDFARTIGIDICITDHHEIPEILPNTIVVDPKLPNQKYPCSFLCGTGVAFKIVQALSGKEEAKKYLGIAAIATIADIVPLRDENRAIVQLGMKDFKDNLPQGIKMLFAKNNLNLNASSTDIAFKIAPKINAAGRMGDASVALKLFIKSDKILLKNTIETLSNLNLDRQAICNRVYDDAIARISHINIANYNAIVLSSKEWDSGILGIVAAKIAGEFNRPTILFSEIDGELKGSARSVNEIDIFSAISSMREVLVAFGGHKMAAGLTIKKKDFTSFLTSLNKYLATHYTPKDFVPLEKADLVLKGSDISEKLVEDLQLLEPTGCENPRPIFKVELDDRASITSMNGHPKHINITSGNLSLVAFNSYKYLPLLRQSSNREVTFELQESLFKSKKYVRGIARSFSVQEIIPPRSGLCQGEYLKQLYYSSNVSTRTTTFDESDLENLISKGEEEMFGTLFVCNEYNSFKKICELTKGKSYQKYIYEVISNSGINAIILAPSGFENFGAYKKIVFLNPPLSKGYISKVAQNTSAQIFLPKTTKWNKNIFNNLKEDRTTFGIYFKAFEKVATSRASFVSDTGLFKEVYQFDKQAIFNQFIFCLYTFLELGIFEITNDMGIFSLVEHKEKSTLLTKSNFYNQVCFLKKLTEQKLVDK